MKSNWKLSLISDLCEIKYGKALKKESRAGGGIPVYGSNGIVGYHNESLVKKETIIIGRKGSIGEVHHSLIPSWPIDTTYYVEFKDKVLYLNWFYRLLKTLNLNNLNRSAAIPGLNRNDIYRIKIPIPENYDDQVWIAGILSRAEGLIGKRKESIQLLDEILRSTFLEMFGDPVRNEKGWEKKTLRSISIKFSDGPFGSNLKTCHYEKTGVRVIRLKNIGINKFLNTDKAFIGQKHFDEVLKKYKCLPGDVVIGTMGEPNIRACIIPEYIEMAVNKADCVLCRPNKEKTLKEYLTGIMNLPSFLSLASNLFHGQTRTRVSMGQLATIEIPIPPLPLQNQFAAIVEKVEVVKAKYKSSLEELECLYGSLSQRAFKGELDMSRVPVERVYE